MKSETLHALLITIGVAVGVAVICGIGYAVFGRLRKKDKEQELLERSREELKLWGDKFEGLYGSTARFLKSDGDAQRAEDLCFRWESRLEHEEQAQSLRTAWQRLKVYEGKKRLEKWFDFFMAAGVKESEEREVVADRGTLQSYDLPDEEGDYTGKRLQVENPCWLLEEKILEKGTLKE